MCMMDNQQEPKARINLSIDVGVLTNIKDKGLNISGLCESHLRDIISTFESTTDPITCRHKWTWAFSTPFGLAKECVRCRAIKRVTIKVDSKDVWINENAK